MKHDVALDFEGMLLPGMCIYCNHWVEQLRPPILYCGPNPPQPGITWKDFCSKFPVAYSAGFAQEKFFEVQLRERLERLTLGPPPELTPSTEQKLQPEEKQPAQEGPKQKRSKSLPQKECQVPECKTSATKNSAFCKDHQKEWANERKKRNGILKRIKDAPSKAEKQAALLRKIDNRLLHMKGKAGSELVANCAICTEGLTSGVISLSCDHEFHETCYGEWEATGADRTGDVTCPMCRKKHKVGDVEHIIQHVLMMNEVCSE
jgi:hypothetical protein